MPASLPLALRAYADARGPASAAHAVRYAGLELIRRTIGAARSPAVSREDAALRVLAAGAAWARSPGALAL